MNAKSGIQPWRGGKVYENRDEGDVRKEKAT